MLVIRRATNEGVVLYDARTGEKLGRVFISEVDRGLVRLAFDCPETISIRRDEVDAKGKAA